MLLRLRGRSDKLTASMFDFSTNAKHKEAGLFLETLWKGLDYLCQQVDRAERERSKSFGWTEETAKNFAYCDFGNHPDDWLVCNYFVWYANALSNFIGVFTKAFSVSEDLEDDFANVVIWRNKVAAHTSWVWPKKDDSPEMQSASIMLFPEFNFGGDGHFEVGGFWFESEQSRSRREAILRAREERPTETVADGGRDDELPDPYWHWQWGLVRTHERLKEIVSKYAAATPTRTPQKEASR
jgi:hypothetical protein